MEGQTTIDLLALARVITPISCTDASGLPLGSSLSNRRKYVFLDVGLMQHICGIETDLLQQPEIIQINRGSVAEQFVGQELLAHADPNLSAELFFWARDKSGSSSEVDYCIAAVEEITASVSEVKNLAAQTAEEAVSSSAASEESSAALTQVSNVISDLSVIANRINESMERLNG